jgi:type III secretory pathway component EscV
METISFALGVASVLVVLLGTVTVWVTLRVKKIIKENSDLNITINNLEQNIDRRFENLEHHYSDEIKEIHDTINVRTDGVYIRIKEETVSLERHMDHMLETSKKYTDSRIDKLVDAYFEQKEILSKTKQIIKG